MDNQRIQHKISTLCSFTHPTSKQYPRKPLGLCNDFPKEKHLLYPPKVKGTLAIVLSFLYQLCKTQKDEMCKNPTTVF